MAIIKTGSASGRPVTLELDPTFATVITGFRAPEVGTAGGYYRASLVSGTLSAIAANGIFFAFQNPSTNLCLIQNVSIGFRAVAGSATPSSITPNLFFTRSYTAIDATGAATALAIKGQMLTQTRATQLNATLRISNTGALSGGTGTDDAQPLSSLVFTHPGTVSTLGNQTIWQQNPGGLIQPSHPLIIAQNEGFRLRFNAAMLAGNTMVAFVDVEWLECSAF
jgi:hypothetical protein